MRGFGALLSHVSSSFDNFRAELSSLIFPVFAHLYIQMIVEGMTAAGQLLFFFEIFLFATMMEGLGFYEIKLFIQRDVISAVLFSSKYARSVPSMYEEPTQSLIRLTTHSQAASHPLVNALT